MKRRSRHFLVFALAAFFAFGILCATTAAPGQALASVTGCSQATGDMPMSDCEHPTYLCDFNLAGNIFSRGAVTSLRSSDSLKDGLDLHVALRPIVVAVAPSGAKEWKSVLLAPRAKVSLCLLHSVLNL